MMLQLDNKILKNCYIIILLILSGLIFGFISGSNSKLICTLCMKPINYSDLDDDEIVCTIKECKHKFHIKCLKEQLQHPVICPDSECFKKFRLVLSNEGETESCWAAVQELSILLGIGVGLCAIAYVISIGNLDAIKQKFGYKKKSLFWALLDVVISRLPIKSC